MEKILLKEKDKEFWQDPTWYRALSLMERLPLRRAGTDAMSATHQENVDNAVLRLRSWKAQPPFDQRTFFEQRLASASLTEEELLSLLSEPIERVQARISSLPDWLAALRDAFTETHPAENILPLSSETIAH